MTNKLHLDQRGDDMSFISDVAEQMFSDGTTNWGRIASLLAFGAAVARDQKQKGKEECVEAVAQEMSTYLLKEKRDWLIKNNAWVSLGDSCCFLVLGTKATGCIMESLCKPKALRVQGTLSTGFLANCVFVSSNVFTGRICGVLSRSRHRVHSEKHPDDCCRSSRNWGNTGNVDQVNQLNGQLHLSFFFLRSPVRLLNVWTGVSVSCPP